MPEGPVFQPPQTFLSNNPQAFWVSAVTWPLPTSQKHTIFSFEILPDLILTRAGTYFVRAVSYKKASSQRDKDKTGAKMQRLFSVPSTCTD